jgi:hypothetical protein
VISHSNRSPRCRRNAVGVFKTVDEEPQHKDNQETDAMITISDYLASNEHFKVNKLEGAGEMDNKMTKEKNDSGPSNENIIYTNHDAGDKQQNKCEASTEQKGNCNCLSNKFKKNCSYCIVRLSCNIAIAQEKDCSFGAASDQQMVSRSGMALNQLLNNSCGDDPNQKENSNCVLEREQQARISCDCTTEGQESSYCDFTTEKQGRNRCDLASDQQRTSASVLSSENQGNIICALGSEQQVSCSNDLATEKQGGSNWDLACEQQGISSCVLACEQQESSIYFVTCEQPNNNPWNTSKEETADMNMKIADEEINISDQELELFNVSAVNDDVNVPSNTVTKEMATDGNGINPPNRHRSTKLQLENEEWNLFLREISSVVLHQAPD